MSDKRDRTRGVGQQMGMAVRARGQDGHIVLDISTGMINGRIPSQLTTIDASLVLTRAQATILLQDLGAVLMGVEEDLVGVTRDGESDG